MIIYTQKFIFLFEFLVGIGGSLWILIIGIVGLGFGIAWVDISINSQAVLLEKYARKPRLGMCHATYAIGGLVGALVGGGLASSSLSLFLDFSLFSMFGLIPSIIFYFGLISFEDEKNINLGILTIDSSENKMNSPLLVDSVEDSSSDSINDIESVQANHATYNPIVSSAEDHVNTAEIIDNKKSTRSSTSLLVCLCLLGGLAYFGEGSIGDWSAIYLHSTLDASLLVSSFGFALFQLFVAMGRYYSDKLVERYPRYQILQISGIISGLGLGVVVLSPAFHTNISIPLAIIGFGLTGVGISVVAPLIISIAGTSVPDMEPTDAIATVSSLTYIGVLIGPPLIGGLSGAFGQLRYALIVDGALLFLMSLLGSWLGRMLPN